MEKKELKILEKEAAIDATRAETGILTGLGGTDSVQVTELRPKGTVQTAGIGGGSMQKIMLFGLVATVIVGFIISKKKQVVATQAPVAPSS